MLADGSHVQACHALMTQPSARRMRKMDTWLTDAVFKPVMHS
jgi:hypothetical protein